MGYLGKGPGIETVLLIRHKLGGLSYVRTLLMSNPLHIYCALYLETRKIGGGLVQKRAVAAKSAETKKGTAPGEGNTTDGRPVRRKDDHPIQLFCAHAPATPE